MNDRKRVDRPVALAAPGLVFAITACLAWYYDVYVHWRSAQYTISVAALIALFAALSFLAARRIWKAAVSLAAFLAALFAPAAIINDVLKRGTVLAGAVSVALCGVCILVLCALLLRKTRKAPLGIAMAAIMLVTGVVGFGGLAYMRNYTAPTGAGLFEGAFEPMPLLGEADFQVPADGSIEEVRDAIRDLRANGEDRHFTVLIEDGEYNIRQLAFDARDKNTTYRSRDGGVILNGGLSLDPKDFTDFDENIKAIDLTKLGLGPEDWGKLYPFGFASAADGFAGETGPLPVELFYNNERCAMARYPNADAAEPWLKVGKVLDGSGVFEMEADTAARAAGWAGYGDVWMHGFFTFDWADATTAVKSIDGNVVAAAHANSYGFSEYGSRNATGGRYFFYNVFEELDQPGEWYLDRETGILYLWPADDEFNNSCVDISISTETLIAGEGLENITFMGLTLQGTRGDGISLAGNNITIDNCKVHNLAGSAVRVDGCGNTVSNCEIARAGKAGVLIYGGDLETLAPGNSRAVNNRIHGVAAVERMYQCGIHLHGVGNTAAHNEIFDLPHSGIIFARYQQESSLDCVIEYNHIYNVCLESSDAGAVYGGRSWWNARGMAIRYNYIHGLGSGLETPDGIYLDDALSGVAVYGNLLVNVPGLALHLGGGRDLDVRGNVLVNCKTPVSYDDRARQGALSGGWYNHAAEDGPQWRTLWDSPWQTDVWRAAYPALAAISSDFSDPDSPAFAPNPAGSVVTGNVFVGGVLSISDAAKRFSTVENNAQYSIWQLNSLFADPKNGDYRLKENSPVLKKLPDFEGVPLEMIGRGKHPVS